MSRRVGRIHHYHQYNPSKRNPCLAAMVIADQNGILTVEVVDEQGSRLIIPNVLFFDDPKVTGGLHAIDNCHKVTW